ncbi:hypothetical protein Pph01_41600 [Planotetraspora phitsanulokensis]|uniref:Uncharacterized protein n=1 Tax=Planotetraspora phitsanulokensis TaxID=575192 RepID=A0A8J3XF29_9ACTN|nr:hypothetical protein Pph01_41600 [Planotetraspora phitsanulokensis]
MADAEGSRLPGSRAALDGPGDFEASGEGNDTTIDSPAPGEALTPVGLSGLLDALEHAQATTATTTSMPVSTDTRRRQ